MQILDFPYHTCSVRYPERGSQVQMGGSYTYSVKPAAPVARELTLNFDLMKWVRNAQGILSAVPEPEINIMRLDNFYREHEMHTDFIYPHEVYGNMVVKFKAPLEIPPAKRDSFGSVFGVVVSLIEQPV